MTREEIDAIPDEVWCEAYDVAWPHTASNLDTRHKVIWGKENPFGTSIARLLMQLRAKDAEIAALKGDDPDLLAARKAAAGYWRERGHNAFAVLIEAAKHDDHETVQSALRGIKHGREEG